MRVVVELPISVIVLRCMLGLSPPEWAYLATERTGVEVTQGFLRALDRRIRMAPFTNLRNEGLLAKRVKALVTTACQLLQEGAPPVGATELHRLDKVDSKLGASSVRSISAMGVPYAVLLYERFLGRPFAGHRDSVSELVGDVLESTVEKLLSASGVSYRKTKRAERLEGFDQAPDFIVPSEWNPQVVIEAKVTEDDGTARDKVTRIQHLATLSTSGGHDEQPRFEVVACIAGRGFGVRREDMKKLLLATRGKVFTLRNLERLVDSTRLKEFRTQQE